MGAPRIKLTSIVFQARQRLAEEYADLSGFDAVRAQSLRHVDQRNLADCQPSSRAYRALRLMMRARFVEATSPIVRDTLDRLKPAHVSWTRTQQSKAIRRKKNTILKH